MREKEAFFYGRDESVLAPLSFISKDVFWETHVGSTNLFARILEGRARGIICITKGLADFYASRGISREKLLVASDAVDLAPLERTTGSKELLRKELGLPQGARIAAYSGSLGLYSWKGVDVFLEATKFISDTSIRSMFVGGSDKDIEGLKKRYPDDRTVFVGQVSPDAVPKYLKASDALILPNKSGNVVSEKFTSPMKLFEYMASGVPIVASDLPSIREVLSPANATLVPPNNPKALADAILGVLHGGSPVAARAAQALADAKKYTWSARAAKILDFIRK